MSRAMLVAAFLATLFVAPGFAQDKKEWCTDAHMKQMDEMLAKMTNATKKKEASMHLKESQAAMTKGNMAECVKHMEIAHKTMGM